MGKKLPRRPAYSGCCGMVSKRLLRLAQAVEVGGAVCAAIDSPCGLEGSRDGGDAGQERDSKLAF